MLAASLRLYRLGAVSLRGDEAFSVVFSSLPLRDLLDGMAQSEPNPPLYWLLLRGWMALAGRSELAVRLPSVLAGVLVVALTYRLARAVLPRRRLAGGIVGCLAALNPFLIWHAQDARVYSLLAALTVAATWQTLRANRATESGPAFRSCWLAAGLWWLALFAHYFAAFALVCAVTVVALSPEGRRRWKSGLAALAVLGLAYLPWALFAGPLLLDHTKDWIEPISVGQGLARTLAAFIGGATLAEDQQALAAVLGALFATAATTVAVSTWILPTPDSRRPIPNSRFAIPLLALGPPLLLALLSLWRPAFDERFLIGSLPAMLILLAVPVVRWWRSYTLPVAVLLALLGALALRSLTNYYFDPGFVKSPDWRRLAAYLADSAAPADLILEDFEDPAFGYYYRGPAPVVSLRTGEDPAGTQPTERLPALLESHPRLWFFLSGATTATGDWLDAHAERLADGRVYGFRLQVFDSPAGSLAAMIPFEAEFADGARLAGYRLYSWPFPEQAHPDGEPAGAELLHLTLYWQTGSKVVRDYTVFTHFVAADGFRVTGHDSPPALGRRPTGGWSPGETIVDPHDLLIPADLAPGVYSIRVGLYDPATGARLAVVDSNEDYVTLPVPEEMRAP